MPEDKKENLPPSAPDARTPAYKEKEQETVSESTLEGYARVSADEARNYPTPGEMGAMTSDVSRTEFVEGKEYTSTSPPPGWKPTDAYIAERAKGLLEKKVFEEGMIDKGGQTEDPRLGRSFLAEKDWDYKNPPVDEQGNPLGPEGQTLPDRAKGWRPDGQPYFGEGLGGTWNKMASIFEEAVARERPGTEEYAEFQEKLKSADGLWEKTKTRIKGGTLVDAAKIMWTGAMGAFTFAEEAIERPYTTLSMTVEDAASRSDWKPINTRRTDWAGGFGDFLERASPIRLVYNSIRDLQASLSGDKLGVDEWLGLWRDNWQASRMGWSIGAQQESYKQEFFARVAEGENPDLVAMDMEKPFAEFVGRATFDLMWVVGALRKGAKITGELADISDDLLRSTDEFAEVAVRHLDEPVSVLRGSRNVDEIAQATARASQRIGMEVQEEAGKFGLGQLMGTAKRSKAATEAGIFGQWVAGIQRNPDEATEIFRNMARLVSDDLDEQKDAIAYLVSALENPEPIFSEGGIKFAKIMRKAFADEDGVLQFGKFADDFMKLQATGDVQKVWQFIGSKMDEAIEQTFPTLQEAIEQGREVPFTMRMISRMDKGAPGELKNMVNWFAGRAYIGTNPGVAIRGGLYDLFQSVVDTDVTALTKRPGKWAEYSIKWLGTEHPGLTKGFSKADIKGLNSIIADQTGYKDLPTYLQAIKGGEDVKTLDKLTLPMARLLERLEISSSQRLIGKATDDAMNHILRHDRALPAVDDLVKAGLPQDVADNLTERIMSNYGDVEKVRKNIMSMIDDGIIQEFGHGAWLDDASRKTLREFGVYDEFIDSIKSGKPMGEMLDEVLDIKASLLEKADSLAKQHAQAVIDGFNNPDNLAQVNKALYETLDDVGGPPLQEMKELLDEMNDVFAMDSTVNSAWKSARDDVVGKIDNYIHQLGDGELLARWNEMRPRLRGRVGQAFKQHTGANKAYMGKLKSFSDNIRGASDEDLPALIRQAEDFFDIDLPSDKSAANKLWEVVWQDRQSLGFRRARRAAQEEFTGVLDEIKTILPEDVVDEIVGNSAWRERAELMERLATQFDDAIMIDGELKPFAEYTRALLSTGDNKNVVRLLARFSRVEPIAKPGATFFDNKILRVLQDGGMDIDNLNQADPEEAFKIFQDWRVANQFSKQAESLEDILGYRPSIAIPESVSDIFRILDSHKKAGGLSTQEIKKLFKFIRHNGTGEDIAMMRDIGGRASRGLAGDEALLDELADLAKQVHNNLLDDIAEGTGKISNAPATPEIKHLLKKSGIEFSDDISQRNAWQLLYDKISMKADDVKSLTPPYDGGTPTESRDVFESRAFIENAFDNVVEGIRKNYGKTRYVETDAIDENLFNALDDWFTTASSRVDDARLMASKYAQGVRDFALHDYTKRYGFDAALSYLNNFHFWPSRTAYKWMTKRIWNNPGLVSSYIDYREYMQDIHKDAPDWWKYAINTNELLGLNMDNPLFFRLENTFQPIYLMMGTDFTDDKKRVNWWTTVMDDIGRYSPGYFNPLIQYGVATALKIKNEDEAAARWAGRLWPQTQTIKSISSLLGAREGKGIETDPSTLIFSGNLGPYERNRVAKTLAQFVKDGRYSEEEIMDAARTHAGPAWEEAMAAQQKKYAVGNLISSFAGINTRQRTMADLEVDNFWQDYSRLWGLSSDMTDEEFRYNMEAMRQKYPFMDSLLLGRKGDAERDSAYAYAILSRIAPGETDDMAEALGMDYNYIEKFYSTKGDWSNWTEGEKNTFMGAVVDLGASLEIPDNAVKMEWAEASLRYSEMYEDAKELFGEDIWTKIDAAYAQKEVGVNSRETFKRYLEDHPVVEQAMDWRTEQILNDPVLSAYYGGLDKLRSYYEGKMYDQIEKELGNDIWDKWNIYWSYVNTDQEEKARAYRKQHPELKKYGELKEKGLEQIQEQILEFGDKLPEGEPTRLREDVGESIGAQQVEEYIQQPEAVGYTIQEWTAMLGPELTRLAILSYEGERLPSDINELLDRQAAMFGITRKELIENIGGASRE